jgi:IS5 family transposase
MRRCHLKVSRSDALQAVLCGVGYNIHWLLKVIFKKGSGP